MSVGSNRNGFHGAEGARLGVWRNGGPLAEEVVGGPRREGHPGGSGSFGSADGRSDRPGRQHTGGAKRMKGPSGD